MLTDAPIILESGLGGIETTVDSRATEHSQHSTTMDRLLLIIVRSSGPVVSQSYRAK